MAEKQSFVSGLQLWQWRNQAIQAARAADVSPYEVDWLLQEVAGLDRLAISLQSFKDWSQIELQLPLEELEVLWRRRLDERLPVQYITGITPWRQFNLMVSSAVLIPRPETECLIDLAVTTVQSVGESLQLDRGHWVDLGTGSGAIALGLADAFPKATIHAIDRSKDALAIAQKNADNYGLTERIHFYQGSWWQPLDFLKGQFSGMVSNPPYIPSGILPELQAEVVRHEPHMALDGGESGLDCIRHLINVSPTYLRPGGLWLIEMMAGQAEIVRQLLENQGSYYNIQIHPDLEGIERFAIAQVGKE
ncbi:MAG: peptide chain release factor N(5)-glutamine methyltransferase [Calothrix sp. MO_192.B10]|nr:peptide chain release factor N(5)-glutamine methyltransferase [Calothrix sp. MO_192.B10]